MEVGFIGLGTMGRPMASNLILAGHDLTVYDLRKEASDPLVSQGARVAASPSEVARASQVVFTSLPGPREVEHTVLGESGILEGAREGMTFVDLSTNSPTSVRGLHAHLRDKGFGMLDSPVGGNAATAQTREIGLLVGGDEEVFLRVKPVLEAISNQVVHCGAIGSGTVCKLCSNLMGLSVVALLGEAFCLGVKAGVSPEILFEAISKSSGNTTVMQALPPGLFQGNFEPGFMVDLALKDLGLAMDIGREYEVPMDLGHLVTEKFLESRVRGWGKLSALAIIKLQEERSGVIVRSTVAELT